MTAISIISVIQKLPVLNILDRFLFINRERPNSAVIQILPKTVIITNHWKSRIAPYHILLSNKHLNNFILYTCACWVLCIPSLGVQYNIYLYTVIYLIIWYFDDLMADGLMRCISDSQLVLLVILILISVLF